MYLFVSLVRVALPMDCAASVVAAVQPADRMKEPSPPPPVVKLKSAADDNNWARLVYLGAHPSSVEEECDRNNMRVIAGNKHIGWHFAVLPRVIVIFPVIIVPAIAIPGNATVIIAAV